MMTDSLHFHDFGPKDAPVLLLLHGLGGGLSSWDQVAHHLSSDRRVVVPDLLGFGRSPWPDVQYTVDDHLAAIEQLLERLGLDSAPLHVAGHSMGGILAAEFAVRHPEWVRELDLVSLPYFESAEAAVTHVRQYGRLARLMLGNYRGARALCSLMCLLRPLLLRTAPRFYPRLPAEVVRDALRHNFASFSRSMQNVVIRHRSDVTFAKLAGHKVRLIHGDRDRAAPLINVQRMLERLPNWELSTVPGVGHYLPILRAAEVAAFLDASWRHPGSPAINYDESIHSGPSPAARNLNL